MTIYGKGEQQMSHSYSKEQFEAAVKSSTTISNVLNILGIKGKGGNYRVFRKFAALYDIDYSHFTGCAWSKNKQLPIRVPIEKYLNNEVEILTFQLKNRLIREGIFTKICNKCKLTEWLGQPIALELEHINGNCMDNTLSNLCLLCPNCHAQTSTYRGKNKKKSNV